MQPALVRQSINAGINLKESYLKDLEWSEILDNYAILSFFELFASTESFKDLIRGFQFALKNEFATRTKATYKLSNKFKQNKKFPLPPTVAKYKAILASRDRTMMKMDSFMEEWDAWICPVSLSSAFPHCNFAEPIEVDGVKIPYLLACGGYTMPLNFTGNPVVVIPIGQNSLGLPIGVQIVGKRWQDLNLIAIANQIDKTINKFQQPSL